MKLEFSIQGLKWEFGKDAEIRTGVPIPRPTRSEKASPMFSQPIGKFHTIAWINVQKDPWDSGTMTVGVYLIDDTGNNSFDRTHRPDRKISKAFGFKRTKFIWSEYLEYDITLNDPEKITEEAIEAARTVMQALGVKRRVLRYGLTYFRIAYACVTEYKGETIPLEDALRRKFRLKIPEPYMPLL